jgi:DNA mismatch endonuclease (patch repair protein)
MAANRRRDTKPEMKIRSLLHRLGYRFRVDFPIAVSGRRPVRADIAFTRKQVAVFIDGCFWHGCPEHWRPPKSNERYWVAKITRNRERDQLTDELLRAKGWKSVRVWEHEDAGRAIEAVEAALAATSK